MKRKEFEGARRKYREAISAINWSRQKENGRYIDNPGASLLFNLVKGAFEEAVVESCRQNCAMYFEVNEFNAMWTLKVNSRGVQVQGRSGVSV